MNNFTSNIRKNINSKLSDAYQQQEYNMRTATKLLELGTWIPKLKWYEVNDVMMHDDDENNNSKINIYSPTDIQIYPWRN